MTLKWIGAVLVIAGCGGFGFSIALSYQRQLRIMAQLIQVLEYMECELEYRMTPLPQLCLEASRQVSGCMSRVFQVLAKELDNQISPDAGCCMKAALAKISEIPERVRGILELLGTSLGRFHLSGQLKEIKAVKQQCQSELEFLRSQRDNRVRSCQTLGICGGIALVILFI